MLSSRVKLKKTLYLYGVFSPIANITRLKGGLNEELCTVDNGRVRNEID